MSIARHSRNRRGQQSARSHSPSSRPLNPEGVIHHSPGSRPNGAHPGSTRPPRTNPEGVPHRACGWTTPSRYRGDPGHQQVAQRAHISDMSSTEYTEKDRECSVVRASRRRVKTPLARDVTLRKRPRSERLPPCSFPCVPYVPCVPCVPPLLLTLPETLGIPRFSTHWKPYLEGVVHPRAMSRTLPEFVPRERLDPGSAPGGRELGCDVSPRRVQRSPRQ